jgi:threonine dehydrogenase-like Zn-dependent dehydrogenase
MRAVGLDFERRQLCERELPEPDNPGPEEVLIRMHEVGVCGTDRDLAHFQFGAPPAGERFLTLGHEALGQSVACGSAVTAIRPGDWVVPTVRRPCARNCESCTRGRADLCLDGGFQERGIVGLHGYFRDFALDRASDLVAVPEPLLDVAVLLEPLSVAEKAVEIAIRYHEPGLRSAVVLGAGAVGLLAALALQGRGLQVAIHSLEPEDSPRARLVREAGLIYGGLTKADIVIEATGAPEAIIRGAGMMAPLGVMIVLGAADVQGIMPFAQMVMENQTVAGSVNASPQAWRDAVSDLDRMPREILRRLIHRVPARAFRESLLWPPRSAAAPKIVHVLE